MAHIGSPNENERLCDIFLSQFVREHHKLSSTLCVPGEIGTTEVPTITIFLAQLQNYGERKKYGRKTKLLRKKS